MNTAEVLGLIGGGLILAALIGAAMWHGVLVVTAKFEVKVVPPWSRHAPQRKKGAARQARSNGSQNRGPDGRFAAAADPEQIRPAA